jgi:aminoglycoside phosphotransferase (APT) family kinase protein
VVTGAPNGLGVGCGPDLLVPGPVPEDSALSRFLRDKVLTDVLGLHCARPSFRLQRFDGSAVLRCDEECTSVSLALKSYGLKWIDGRQGADDRHQLRVELMQREFDNIQRVRALGLDKPPVRAVRALAVNPDLGCLLVEEFMSGEDLQSAICEAAWHGQHAELSARLAQIACFLARLHNASATNHHCDHWEALTYLEQVVGQLTDWEVITFEQAEGLRRLGRRWEASGELRGAAEVLIHGDATPTQFLFPDNELVVIDFEQLHQGDPAADIGRIAGELKHLFAMYAIDAWASEQHIQRFYRDYYCQAPGACDFGWLTERARFHMGCSELRIARNPWVELGHRRWLIEEAAACLHS